MPVAEKLAQLKKWIDEGTISWQQYFSATRAVNEQAKQLSEELGRQNMAFAQMQAQDMMGNSQLPIQQKIEHLNEAVRNGTLGWREYLGMMDQVKAQGEQAMNDLLGSTSNALTSIFAESKTAAIASALINTYQAVSKALAQYGPTPQGFAMAGIAAAAGMAQVAKIRSTSKSTTSGGGGSVAGGGGGASAAAAEQSAAAPSRESTLFVRGINPKDMYSGEVVRELAKKFIDFQRDGGRLVLE